MKKYRGNTEKSVDVSANGTDINHHVSTDLFDGNEHSLGASPLDQQQVGAGQHPDLVLGEQRWWGLKLSCN